jgi:hypothetical protein
MHHDGLPLNHVETVSKDAGALNFPINRQIKVATWIEAVSSN